jgi:predicted GNAT family acetyltransferase
VPDVRVTDEPESARYILEVDGERIGLLTYRLEGGQIALTHAEVHPRSGGRGLGSELAAYALDDARRRGLSVLPLCPFISDYIRRNPDQADLVPENLRPRFGL